ncbi:hypothetical protein [Nostoc sp. DSM 114167]|uniref:hypothetical protein n=1 Tax=Nostoc sp. DSM 114167 TaxID=3439050 RepID=UPI0040462180
MIYIALDVGFVDVFCHNFVNVLFSLQNTVFRWAIANLMRTAIAFKNRLWWQ